MRKDILTSQLKTLLSQGKDEEVFSSLKASLQEKGLEGLFNEVVILERNLFDLKENHRKGLITPVEFQTQKNRIYHSLIGIIDILGKSTSPELASPASKKSIFPYAIGLVIVGVAAFLIIPMLLKKPDLAAQESENNSPAKEVLKEPEDEEIKEVESTPEVKKTVPDKKPARIVDLSGKWRLEGQWGVVAEFDQMGEKFDFKLKNEDRLLYDGSGTTQREEVVINFELVNGVGTYELEIKDDGKLLEGVVKNAYNNYQGEKVIFRKIVH